MKQCLFSYLILTAMLTQSFDSLACQSQHQSKETASNHCHSKKQTKDTQQLEAKKSSCPICQMQLCTDDTSWMPNQALEVKKTPSPFEAVLLSTSIYRLETTLYTTRPPPLQRVHLSKYRHWPSFSGVFII